MSAEKRVQFGLWNSPISPTRMGHKSTLSEIGWDPSGALVWLERRAGRGVLMVQAAGEDGPRDLNSEHSARGQVGYGGGDFTAGHGQVYFVEAGSGRIFCQPLTGGLGHPITPAFGQAAAPRLSPDGRWLAFIHSYEEQDSLAVVDTAGRLWPQKLAEGADFYMQPAWSPDGSRLAWVEWNFPNMPWDGTRLQLGRLVVPDQGLPYFTEVETIAGDAKTAIFQPEFSPDGRYLAYVSDATGWGQIYLYDLQARTARQLTHAPAEHGTPAWIQGMRRYGFSPDSSRLYFLRNQAGFDSVWQTQVDSREELRLPLDPAYTSLDQIAVLPAESNAGQDQIALLASGGAAPPRVITFSPGAPVRVIRYSQSEDLLPKEYSLPQAYEWKGMDGGAVYGLLFPPHSAQFEGIGKPPLIVHIHGGPTSQVKAAFNPDAQFFTSRGYAFLEVNYRGSTGYGRAYQDALLEKWGIYDVQDAVSGAQALAESGRVDPDRIVIMGGSAGGYTVFKALEDYPLFFKAGICLYGISNQFTAAVETHKFELHYNDMLLGPLPEASEVYRERSPIFFVDKIQSPIAIYQGEDDQVVTRIQSDQVVEALQRRGVPHIYHVYPGEGHGFRKAETIEHFYRSVEQFLKQYVIFA